MNGNIDSALYGEVRAAILLPRSHNNSEWIHLKILEAKKELLSDRDWCLKNNITAIIDSANSTYGRVRLLHHEDYLIFDPFLYQLNERLPFTYGEDKVLGKLLFELGDAYQSVSTYRSYIAMRWRNIFILP